MCALVSIYSYKLTVSNGGGGHLPLVSICALSLYTPIICSFKKRGSICLWYLLCIGLYIFLYFDCFKWGGGSFAFGIYMCIGLYIFL